MKNARIRYITAVFLFIGVLLLSSSASTQGIRPTKIGESPNNTIIIQNPISFRDFLERAPGLVFRGNEVSIRGGGPPLYIVDGLWVGNNYQNAANAVNVQDIAFVEVLIRPSEIAMYGMRGSNGVILIHTKGANPDAGKY